MAAFPPFVHELLARCDFPEPVTPVACAVSGGADSLALLVLAVAAGCEVTAVHVDHGLRPGSAAEAEVVHDAAQRFGAGFVGTSVQIDPGPNLEARAREARYRALPLGALTGHTADDQAETVLLNLLRGAALDGLRGFDAATRPIRRLRRQDTVRLCRELGLRPVSDPSNADPSYRRNRVRAELVPLLDDIAARDVTPLLARQAELLADDAALLDALAAELDPTDAKALTRAPAALARRVLRGWLRGDGAHPPDAATIERVRRVAAGQAVACEIGGGRSVRRSGGRLRIEG